MNRREALLAILAFGTQPLHALAQQAGKVWRIGILSQSDRKASDIFDHFLRGLRELGYVEGKNLSVEWRFADNALERLPALAAELVALKPDALVSMANAGPLALQQATSTIPIVMTSPSGDPVASGLVKSLARPGGNITGLSTLNADLSQKRLELLRGIAPNLSPVAVLLHPASPASRAILDSLRAAAQGLGVTILPIEIHTLREIEDAFGVMARHKARAVIVSSDPLFSRHRIKLAELAVKNRLPSMTVDRLYAEAGCLVSYGTSLADSYHRAATYVDKILKGAKPADLPVEQPTTFELVINLKTAKALGLKIPQSLLVRADAVIE
ncbi:MAG: ABC transporter substrate-binding protein [Betaproteobacteria bacterium]|nr:ABC transporter substrate-binding protein [Betaproteobacteria bacterium]